MLIDNIYLTRDSIRFLLSLVKSNQKTIAGKRLIYNNLEADFYPQSDRLSHRGMIIVFHGLNQQGNKDTRILKLANSLVRIGFSCLVPKLNAYTEIRLPCEEDFDALSIFLEHLLNHQIETNNRILFLGPSVSCLFIAKIASKANLRNKIESLCLISPYFSAEHSFKEILESPKDFYAQLVILKLLLYSQFLQEKDKNLAVDMQLLNETINLCFLKKSEPATKDKAIKFIMENCTKKCMLPHFINRLGHPGFITEEIEPFFQDVTQKAYYKECLPQINAAVTLIHSLNDTIFSPINSIQLAEQLSKNNINHHMVITRLLEHADIKVKNIIKELVPIIKSLNHFFSGMKSASWQREDSLRKP